MKFGCPEPSKKVFDFWNFCSSKRRLRLRLPLVHISMKLLLSTKSNNMEMMLMIMVMLMMPTTIIMVMMGMKIDQIGISKQFILCQWYLNPEVIKNILKVIRNRLQDHEWYMQAYMPFFSNRSSVMQRYLPLEWQSAPKHKIWHARCLVYLNEAELAKGCVILSGIGFNWNFGNLFFQLIKIIIQITCLVQ